MNDFDAAVRGAIAAALHTCPTFLVPPDVFAAYLRDRLPANLPPPIALQRMHTADLYLACACARGDPRALAAFDERCLGQLDRTLSRSGIDRDTIAEVKQEIRCRVLVGDGRPPEIVDFSGRGDLCGWVRVMATRQALRRQGRARRELATEDDELCEHMAPPDPPELDRRKGAYRREFKRAFEIALQALPARDQTLLRQHYLDGATLDELALLYRVHRATVARQLGHARERVLTATRERLKSQLEMRSQEIDSILRMIWSRVEISVRGLRRGRRR